MSAVRIGVIGSGPVTEKHLDVLTAIPGITVTALSSRRADRRQELARRYSIAQTYPDHRGMLDGASLDGVMVLVAPEAMASVARDCLVYGRPLFLEKPPALSVSEAEELASIAGRHGVPTVVGLNRRFYSTVASARRAIAARGRLLGIHVDAPENLARLKAAGRSEAVLSRLVHANGIHAVDLLRSIGGKVLRVDALRSGARDRDETSAAALVEFEDGVIGQYASHWGSAGSWRLTLYGRDVKAVLDPLERGFVLERDGAERPLDIDPVDEEFKPGFLRQAHAFVDVVRTGRPAPPPAADLADAVTSMELGARIMGHA
jgi:predicted dehydrogenase